jgi:AhpD family alkylhydroperoxidase
MQTIPAIQPEHADISTKRLLDGVNKERGGLSNMIKTMAQSPRALEGYLCFRKALGGSSLTPQIREQIALTVAQTNLCEYSLAEHGHLAAQLGLPNAEILASSEARANDRKTESVLRFARGLAAGRGEGSAVELKERGYSDADIIDVIALVALNVFENLVNDVARTSMDAELGAFGERWLTASSR